MDQNNKNGLSIESGAILGYATNVKLITSNFGFRYLSLQKGDREDSVAFWINVDTTKKEICNNFDKMKGEILSFKAPHQPEKEYSLTYSRCLVLEVIWLEPGFGYRKIQMENGEVEINLVFTERTTKRSVERNLDFIKKEVRKLQDVQGIRYNEYLRDLLLKKTDSNYLKIFSNTVEEQNLFTNEGVKLINPSWLDLTMDVNFDLFVCCMCMVKEDVDSIQYKTAEKFFTLLLKTFDFSQDDNDVEKNPKNILEDALENLKTRQLNSIKHLWNIKNYPIPQETVRSKVRNFKKSYGGDLNIIRRYRGTSDILEGDLFFVSSGDWQRAIETLESLDPKAYKRYYPRFQGRMSELTSYSLNKLQGFIRDEHF